MWQKKIEENIFLSLVGEITSETFKVTKHMAKVDEYG